MPTNKGKQFCFSYCHSPQRADTTAVKQLTALNKRSLLSHISLIPPHTKTGRRPSVYIQNLSGDEISSVRNEESNSRGYIGWQPNASPWHDCIPKLRRVSRNCEVSRYFYNSGSNCVHPDTLWSQFDRQFTREGIDSSLRSSISWVSRKTAEAMYRGNIYDATPSPLQQERQGKEHLAHCAHNELQP